MNQLHYYFPPSRPPEHRELTVDILAYGSSPGAITAAIEAARRGRTTALVINSARIGGLTASGLGNTDIGNKRSIGGLAREFYRRVGARYGVAEEWRFEPHIAEQVLEQLLRENNITPHLREYPAAIERTRAPALIHAIRFESGLVIRARQFIDASYEGDLLALAGISHTIGREANAEFAETLNGVQLHPTHQFDTDIDPFIIPGDPASGLLPGINPAPLAPIGSGDTKMQAYNFRMCLTQSPDRIPFPKPDAYAPLDYELLARYLRTGWSDLFHKFDRIRGGKTDTNNHGAVSTDYIGGNWDFPAATWRRREQIYQAHIRWQQGLMWFLANDDRVPAPHRAAMRAWGLAPDEFTATGGWPHQLYIRESRRLKNEKHHIITEHHCKGRLIAPDSIGLGAYAMDSHNTQRVVIDGCVRNEGDVQVHGFNPYPISYRALTPLRSEAENLLVPVCLAATHIAYGSIRMEPVFMILGQSAALAAHLALETNTPVQDIPYPRLRALLDETNQVTTWTPGNAGAPAAYEPEAAAPA